jgi:hypothetical protein
MKTRLSTLGVILSVSVIVLSLALPVNHSSLTLSLGSAVLAADGNPGPGWPPPPTAPKGGVHARNDWRSRLA